MNPFRNLPRPALGMLLVAGLGVLAVLPALTPFVGPAVRDGLMTAFAGVCHQIPDRSPQWFGYAWAICHRDAGIYWGLPVGAAAWLLTARYRNPERPRRINLRQRLPIVFAIALVPMGLDWGLDVAGMMVNTPVSRIATGAVFGITGGVLLAFSLFDQPVSGERLS